MIEERILPAGGAEEGAPLAMDAGVERELDGNVALDGGEANGLSVQGCQRERSRACGRSAHGSEGLLHPGGLELLCGFVVGERHGGEAGGLGLVVSQRGGGGRGGAAQT